MERDPGLRVLVLLDTGESIEVGIDPRKSTRAGVLEDRLTVRVALDLQAELVERVTVVKFRCPNESVRVRL